MCVWPTALKLSCITNFDMLFLVMGFISLVDEIQFMLISSCHICIRSISWNMLSRTYDVCSVVYVKLASGPKKVTNPKLKLHV